MIKLALPGEWRFFVDEIWHYKELRKHFMAQKIQFTSFLDFRIGKFQCLSYFPQKMPLFSLSNFFFFFEPFGDIQSHSRFNLGF